MSRRSTFAVAAGAVAALTLAACGSGGSGDDAGGAAPLAPAGSANPAYNLAGVCPSTVVVQTTVDRNLSEMRSDMATSQRQHQLEHQRDRDKRNSLIRWAVTSIMTGIGVLVALYVAMKGGG